MARFKLQQVFSDDCIYVWNSANPTNVVEWSIPTIKGENLIDEEDDDDYKLWSIPHIESIMRARVGAACDVVDGDSTVGHGEFLIETDDNRMYLLCEA